MAKNIDKLAGKLGAKIVAKIPDVGGGAFGAARMAAIVQSLQTRLKPGEGIRPGRPSDPSWVTTPKVPMSKTTVNKLALLAERASNSGRKVSPMQMAAQLLEEAVAALPEG